MQGKPKQGNVSRALCVDEDTKAVVMHHVRRNDLPFAGSSHQFVGAQQGDVNVSVFLFNGLPGSGPPPHRHPYDEVQFVRAGRGRWKVNGVEFEGTAGDIFVIKAGEIHEFTNIGDEPLVQLDVHLSPRFIQEDLPPGSNVPIAG